MLLKIFFYVNLVSRTILASEETANSSSCVLPPYPKHGSYLVKDPPRAQAGDILYKYSLHVTCDDGYGLLGESDYQCFGYLKTGDFPECLPICKTNSNSQVLSCGASPESGSEARCLLTNVSLLGVRPRTNTNDFDDCGDIGLEFSEVIAGGRSAERHELPWHAGIYTKTKRPYMQICGGSLISSTVIISAAHCFWNDVAKQLPASNYAVAVGKIYRPWNNNVDDKAQKSDVKEIKIPPRFQGSATNYQDDIALVIVSTEIQFKSGVSPVCLNFNYEFDSRQLQEGNLAKVAGWGLTDENGRASPVLKVAEMPYVNIENCLSMSPPDFQPFVTSDKICAGYTNGTAVCKGDSGGGLVFPYTVRGSIRYFLRGIVSTAPKNENLCNIYTLATFTHLIRHEHFIKSVHSGATLKVPVEQSKPDTGFTFANFRNTSPIRKQTEGWI